MIHHGDLFDVLPTLTAESISACVTDPPYGIGFMGKQWDTFKPGVAEARIVVNTQIDSDNPNLKGRTRGPASSPSAVEYDYSAKALREFQAWTEKWAREVFRVLKPGGYLLVCGAPRSHHRMIAGVEDAGFEIRDCIAWLFGSGFPKSLNFEDGWGTALKPAHEPIVVARKPFKGSVEANRTTFGTGAINIDGCRIKGEWSGSAQRQAQEFGAGKFHAANGRPRADIEQEQNDLGRWPSNVALDEVSAALLDEQTGELSGPGGPARSGSASAWPGGAFQGQIYPGEIGGASRFFYVAKPSRAERDQGCEHLAPKQRDDSRKEGNPGGDNPRNRGLQKRGNHHPTVKPVELMRYLVRLVTPVGGTVLDPFTGSGTTGMACAFEGFDFIGIEREAEYVEIAERRIASCVPLFSVAEGETGPAPR